MNAAALRLRLEQLLCRCKVTSSLAINGYLFIQKFGDFIAKSYRNTPKSANLLKFTTEIDVFSVFFHYLCMLFHSEKIAMESIFEISYYILIGALSLLGLVLFILPTRDDPRLGGYRFSLRLMAVSFLSLALYCSFKWAVPRQLFSIYFLLMSHLQCNLLGLGHINMVSPKSVTKTFVWRHLIPLICCVAAYLLVLPFCTPVALTSYSMLRQPDVISNPEVFLRVIWMGVYLINTVYYGVVFFREYKAYSQKADDFYSEIDARAMGTVRASFIFALCVAATTIFITASLNPYSSAALNGCILVFYTVMGAFYIQYPKIFPQMEPVIYEDNSTDSAAGSEDTLETEKSAEEALWLSIRQRIIDEELYARHGLTMESLARELALSRTRMSRLINHFEQVNFNTFINTLRIELACELIRQNPDIRMVELADRVGYADVSNFFRSFKLIRKQTPKQFRSEL